MSRMGVLTKRRPSNRRRVPERDVLRAVLDLLTVERIWHRRMNTGAVKAEGRFFRFGSVGMADVLVLPRRDGPTLAGIKRLLVPLWIECKGSGGQQSEAQRAFQAEVEAEGHSYLLVSDIDDLAAFLKERGL